MSPALPGHLPLETTLPTVQSSQRVEMATGEIDALKMVYQWAARRTSKSKECKKLVTGVVEARGSNTNA